MEIYLKIAQLYLEEQNHVSAEAYINRAALLQSETKNKDLQTIYKVDECSFTRVLLEITKTGMHKMPKITRDY